MKLPKTTKPSRPFKHTVYLTDRRNRYTRFTSSVFFDNHLKFAPDIEAATTDQIIPMVIHNLGIGFCPEKLAKPFIESGDILQIPLIESELEREICLIQDISRGTSIAVSKLINMLIED